MELYCSFKHVYSSVLVKCMTRYLWNKWNEFLKAGVANACLELPYLFPVALDNIIELSCIRVMQVELTE